MREILFRGKQIDNGEWSEGHYHYANWYLPPSMEIVDVTHYILPIGHGDAHKVDPSTVGQFTGLTDKNGKKIFEGDICKGAWGTIFQVVYDDCYLGFRAKEKSGLSNCIDYYGLDRIEVIGNIHDNPELLEV